MGRGVGSGLGKTAGRGQKGQYARTRGFKPHFEGGQTPIQRRLPKRGFNNPFPRPSPRSTWATSRSSPPARRSTRRRSATRGLVKGRFDRIKILGDGELTKAVTVTAHAFSQAAAEKIEKAGGKVVLLGAARSA